jgi:hypothetical protein
VKQSLGASDDRPWSQSFVNELLDRKYTSNNKSEEGRLYVACIFADLIRLTENQTSVFEQVHELKTVFTLCTRELSKLGDSDDSHTSIRFYLLERLSVHKAFGLLSKSDDDDINDLAVKMMEHVFEVFYDNVK